MEFYCWEDAYKQEDNLFVASTAERAAEIFVNSIAVEGDRYGLFEEDSTIDVRVKEVHSDSGSMLFTVTTIKSIDFRAEEQSDVRGDS